ncbi:MAG: sulfatase [Deltaproteobacteria bacterium]|nr:sulfatase [Deltaproteobacteria bacterium]
MRGSIIEVAKKGGIYWNLIWCWPIITVVLAAGCAHLRERLRPPAYSVVLLTLDSINVRHVGAYGYGRDTTPHLDRLAREGALFMRAYSTSAWTSPGLVSILTGLYPTAHGVRERGKSVPHGLTTLPRALARRGYQSPGLSYLLSIPNYAYLGFSPTPTDLGVAPDEADDAALRLWLAARPQEPFFLWYHYAISHLPYRPPEPWRSRFYREGEAETEFVRKVNTLPVYRKSEHEMEVTPGERKAVEDLYDAELAYQDHLLGKTLDYMRKLELLDRAILIITADHGEEVLERGFVGHASTSLAGTLHGELTNIPLIMRFPGGRYRGVIDQPVSQVDIMPTILDFLDIKPPAGLQGRTLMPLIRGEKTVVRPLFQETTTCGYQCPEGENSDHLTSIVMGSWKLISTRKGSKVGFELYDLERDPDERHNLILSESRQAEIMKQVLARQILLNQSLASDLQRGPQGKLTSRAGSPDLAPIILLPHSGDTLRFSPGETRIVLEWVGSEAADYTIEYRVGSGDKLLSGRFGVRGNRKKFGPIPLSTWEMLPNYNPFRFRIRQEPDGPWSPWREFTISAG